MPIIPYCNETKFFTHTNFYLQTSIFSRTKSFTITKAPSMQVVSVLFVPNNVSHNQVLTHAARAAAKQLNKLLFSHLWWPRAARAKGSG